MDKFIEVHCKGERHLINVDWIEEIYEDSDCKVTIFFAFNIPNGIEQDRLQVDETYDKIRRMLWSESYG